MTPARKLAVNSKRLKAAEAWVLNRQHKFERELRRKAHGVPNGAKRAFLAEASLARAVKRLATLKRHVTKQTKPVSHET